MASLQLKVLWRPALLWTAPKSVQFRRPVSEERLVRLEVPYGRPPQSFSRIDFFDTIIPRFSSRLSTCPIPIEGVEPFSCSRHRPQEGEKGIRAQHISEEEYAHE